MHRSNHPESAQTVTTNRSRTALVGGSWRLFVLAAVVSTAATLILVACSSGTTDDPTATSATAADTPTRVVAATVAPSPTDAAAQTATETDSAPDATPEGTRETELATAFADWGSTCLNDNYPPPAPKLEDVDTADYQTDEQGVRFYTVVEGFGEQPELDWDVEVSYTGWLADGCIFDSSYTRSEQTRFPVSGVIPGWQGSLMQMKVGERRRVEIPPALAYGEQGSPPVIPANATLTFDIILVAANDPNLEIMRATQTAELRLEQATAEAAGFDESALEFSPNTVDVTTDASGFFALLPEHEVTCMQAYAGGADELEQLFSLQSSATNTQLVDQLDECLSDTTTKNILVGRIVLLGGPFTDETVECMADRMINPSLRPLFGVFESTSDTEQWVSTHFCMNESERVAFDRALYANSPDQQPGVAGATFVDIQECMVDRLGAERFFARVSRPDPEDAEAVTAFYISFADFLVADIDCRTRESGFTTADNITLTLDGTKCAIEALGKAEFGRAILGRDWVPTVDQHTGAAEAFTECGIETDFLAMPDSIGNLDSDQVTCLAGELANAVDPAESSFQAFSQLGSRKRVIAGDFVSLMFGADTCGIEIAGLPSTVTITSTSATCIVGKIDDIAMQTGINEALAEFDRAVNEAADCAAP